MLLRNLLRCTEKGEQNINIIIPISLLKASIPLFDELCVSLRGLFKNHATYEVFTTELLLQKHLQINEQSYFPSRLAEDVKIM